MNRKQKKRYVPQFLEIAKKYGKRLQKPKINCYKCRACGHITKTQDIHNGVTPFAIGCEKCKALSTSSFYNDICIDKEPTIEWYRPTYEEFITLKSIDDIEHVVNGGLLSRKIKKNG